MNLKNIFKRKEKLPTLYDRRNNPIKPPNGSRYSKKRHKLQRPTIFTKKETEEILEKQSIKDNELE